MVASSSSSSFCVEKLSPRWENQFFLGIMNNPARNTSVEILLGTCIFPPNYTLNPNTIHKLLSNSATNTMITHKVHALKHTHSVSVSLQRVRKVWQQACGVAVWRIWVECGWFSVSDCPLLVDAGSTAGGNEGQNDKEADHPESQSWFWCVLPIKYLKRTYRGLCIFEPNRVHIRAT